LPGVAIGAGFAILPFDILIGVIVGCVGSVLLAIGALYLAWKGTWLKRLAALVVPVTLLAIFFGWNSGRRRLR